MKKPHPGMNTIDEETENESPVAQDFKVPHEVIQKMVVQKKREVL